MNRKLVTILALLLALVTLLTSCGEYVPPTGTHRPGDTPDTDNPSGGGGDGDGGEGGGEGVIPDEGTPYTVSFVLDGQPFIPTEEITVSWSNGFSIHSAPVDETGKASVTGIDGNYNISLSRMPEGYAANPNIYKASSVTRDVQIELFKLNILKDKNTSLYNCYEIAKEGIYYIEIPKHALKDESKEVYYEFAPTVSGNYSVESWVDVSVNQVNPLVNYYGANRHFKQLQDPKTLEYGAESSYTRNFKLTVELTDSMISTGGQVTFTFGIKATSKTGEYPVGVYFHVYKNKDVPDPYGNEKPMILPSAQLEKQKDYDGTYTYTYPESTIGTYEVLESDNFRLWEKGTGMPMTKLSGQGTTITEQLTGAYSLICKNIKKVITFTPSSTTAGTVVIEEYLISPQDGSEARCAYGTYSYAYNVSTNTIKLTHRSDMEIEFAGFTISDGVLQYGTGDDYYHVWDKEHETYGPLLYADITVATRFIDLAFTHVEDPGNKCLTFEDGNYKFFIEGWDLFHKVPGYLCVNFPDNNAYCPCLNIDDPSKGCGGACLVGCEKCHDECRNVTQELLDSQGGYADYVNSDGRYAVNAELKEFLQTFSIRQSIFFDGNGVAETDPETPVFAAEEDQWLFACGYYTR